MSDDLHGSFLDQVNIVHVCDATLTKRLIEFENTESGSLTVYLRLVLDIFVLCVELRNSVSCSFVVIISFLIKFCISTSLFDVEGEHFLFSIHPFYLGKMVRLCY